MGRAGEVAMAVKPGAKTLSIKEQILHDRASGLTLMFEALSEGRVRLRICGRGIPTGTRDLIFGPGGGLGVGEAAQGVVCKPSWLRAVKD
jgi:hypothetical protein